MLLITGGEGGGSESGTKSESGSPWFCEGHSSNSLCPQQQSFTLSLDGSEMIERV